VNRIGPTTNLDLVAKRKALPLPGIETGRPPVAKHVTEFTQFTRFRKNTFKVPTVPILVLKTTAFRNRTEKQDKISLKVDAQNVAVWTIRRITRSNIIIP
jgi:hypothetical protein